MSLTLPLLSLLFLRFFLGLVVFLCGSFCWRGILSLRSSKRTADRLRWLVFVLVFGLAGGVAYFQLVTPADYLRRLTDTARPQQVYAVFPREGKAILFWETAEPLTSLVRYGHSPDEMVYLARPDEIEPARLHQVVLEEPLMASGVWAVIYSGGRKYDLAGQPFRFFYPTTDQ
ncbi:hypothetical protein MUP65_01985 [Patescibacteria group bacterium]|nr:hypothetical protein [Patescibacteria group bacterium]